MPLKIRYFLIASVLVIFGSLQSSAQTDAELNQVRNAQIEVKTGATQFVEDLRPIFAELRALGATRDDISVIEDTLITLQQLDSRQMNQIIAALDGAISAPDSRQAREQMSAALEGQGAVGKVLRDIFERLRVRRGELERASRADRLRERQSENHHRTERLKDGEGDRDVAKAEQKAIEEAVRQLTQEMAAAQDEAASTRGETPSSAEKEKLKKMEELATKATAALEEEKFEEAAQAQQRLEEMLNDIAAETGREPASADFLQDLLAQLNDLLERQRSLIGDFSNRNLVYSEQDAIAVATNAMIVSVQGVSAPSGFQVESASRAMRRALTAINSGDPTAHQRIAVQHLELAIQLLDRELDKVGGPSAPSGASGESEGESDENSAEDGNSPDDNTSSEEDPNSSDDFENSNDSSSENESSNEEGESENSSAPKGPSDSPSEASSDEPSDASSDKPSEKSGDASSEKEKKDSLEELARLYEKANQLRDRQKAQSQESSSQAEQQAIASETAALQSDVLAESPEAARELGRAAVRMAESMNPQLTPEEQASLRAEAAEALSEASETLLAEGREQYSERQSESESDSQSDSQSASDSDSASERSGERWGLGENGHSLADNASEAEFRGEVFGDVELSPADRSAIEAARSEPVSPSFAPMVESYYEKLSKLSAE